MSVGLTLIFDYIWWITSYHAKKIKLQESEVRPTGWTLFYWSLKYSSGLIIWVPLVESLAIPELLCEDTVHSFLLKLCNTISKVNSQFFFFKIPRIVLLYMKSLKNSTPDSFIWWRLSFFLLNFLNLLRTQLCILP